ncbi:MAG TPA: hypothetical protein PK954_09375 [Anaerolineales bacterium]|nr:hypothetical protein [Anaerolineales bacterium]
MKTIASSFRWNILLALVAALLVTACTSPYNQVGFQGRLLTASGSPVNGNVNMQVVYWTCETGTSGLGCSRAYTDTATVVTDGLFSFPIGEAAFASSGGPDPAVYAQPLWAELTVNGETLAPRQPLTGSPYAMTLVSGAVIGDGQGIGTITNDDSAVVAFNPAGVSNHTVSGQTIDYGTLTLTNAADGTLLVLANAGSGDYIRGCTGTGANDRTCSDLNFRVQANGNVTADGSFTGGGADFAERIEVDGVAARLQPGDVLVISDRQDRSVEISTEPYATAVLGVYSTQPGFVGGTTALHDDPTGTVPVAFVGIVPVKVTAVNGPIRRGDLLTTSSVRGHAMLATEYVPGAILGKAMGELISGTGVIEVALIIR